MAYCPYLQELCHKNVLVFTFYKSGMNLLLKRKINCKTLSFQLEVIFFLEEILTLGDIKSFWEKIKIFPFLSVSLRKTGFFLSLFLEFSSLPICLFLFQLHTLHIKNSICCHEFIKHPEFYFISFQSITLNSNSNLNCSLV